MNEWLAQTGKLRSVLLEQEINAGNCFQYTKEYSRLYDELIKGVTTQISEQIFGKVVPEGLILYSFGAPSRNELYGSSDADIIVYREENNTQTKDFLRLLKEELTQYDFSKVDLPEWGTFADVANYQNTSVTEANQIIESQFITGDLATRDSFEKLREDNFNQYNVARNLVFQFNYFNQYFEKKCERGSINLKYSPSGTRNSLFFLWYSQLKRGIHKSTLTATEEGLQLLYDEKRISDSERANILESAAYVSFLRDQVMRSDPKDTDGIISLGASGDASVVKLIEKADKYMRLGKSCVWAGLSEYLCSLYPKSWETEFQNQLAGNWQNQKSEFQDDEILNTLKVWNMKDSSLEACSTFERLSDSDSWVVLASMLANENCPSETIDYVVRNKAVNKGFEYLFEIVTRNKNTRDETLDFIVNCNQVEARFKKAAKKKLGEYGLCQ